ncbi:ankyrin repeat-containing domain protein [Fusarium flagelliforme]|uniref:F-box domain-containing protein n=1 Tax=Fusarium flagelliforme TaxID=2675880 RepID=A0A395N337_9HYPO|nr:ankyrin repeat-containing domain protein [Fusarium flagelliforme]KAH7174804.1 ankyrin repeat-containing domain protein [Fusarium flagelliforme]RFN54405.1 hypothetical protein FIE12Z_1532 [Fusarium flagelliforme]
MSLQNLPTEIIELIAERVHQLSSLNSLCRMNRRFHIILNWHLYRRDAKRPCKALLWGAFTGNLKVMQRSLEHGANIHAKNIEDKTPLLRAVEGQSLEAIKFLLDRGADINYSNTFADSIMYVAVFTRNVDVVKLVLERGANPDALSYANTRPLSLAVARNDIAIAEALVKHKARMDEPGPGYYTPLITAVHEARYDILRMFIENGVFSTDKDGSLGAEGLRRAVLNKDYEALDILLKAGADPGKNGWHGRCTIMEAMRFDTEDLAISLSGGIVNLKELKDKDGEGLLYYAVSSRCKRFTKYLLDRGLSIDDTNEPELRGAFEALFSDESHSSRL